MKALVFRSYGNPSDVVKVEEVQKPALAPGRVLVKVHAASINAADKLMMGGDTLLQRLIAGGLRTPGKQIMGVDMAGVVEAVAPDVKHYAPGDAVYGDLSSSGYSGFAEYVTVKAEHIVLKPENLSFAQAAAVPLAGHTALQGLRDIGRIKAGQDVLITGASGGVGSFAVQLAKYFGASVTAMASAGKLASVRQLGADRVLDYAAQDVTKSGLQFDLILDIAAYRPFSDYRALLKPGGRYVLAGGSISRIMKTLIFGRFASIFGGKTFTNVAQAAKREDLLWLNSLLEVGAIKPVIDGCYSYKKYADAFSHFSGNRTCGKVIINMVEPAN